MAVKRKKRKSKSKASEAYQQAMLAEGAPAALDLLGFGSTIGDLIRGKPRKAKKKRRAKKKARAKVKTSRTKRAKKTKRKSVRRTSRRRT
jgi:hypothetical protein